MQCWDVQYLTDGETGEKLMARKTGKGDDRHLPAPTFIRRQLGLRLKGARERAKLTQEAAAKALLAHPSKIWRIETGRAPVKPQDVREVCELFGLSAEETESLVRLARATHTPGWVEDYRDAISEELGLLASLEENASRILAFDPNIINGALQTQAYAWEMFQIVDGIDDSVRRRRLEFRMQRQALLLGRKDDPELRFVIGEAALRCVVGTPEVMREQLEHLAQLGERLDIRVRPFSEGQHLWPSAGSFLMLSFPEPDDPAVVYTETHLDSRYMETAKELAKYAEIFGKLHESSTPIKEFVS